MKHTFYLIVITALFTNCKQRLGNVTAIEKTTNLTPLIVDTAVATVQQQTQIVENNIQVQTEILNKWLTETIGCDFPVDSSIIKKASFNSFNYKKKAVNTFITLIEFKETGKKAKISSSNKLIKLEFSDDGGYETFFAEEHKFTYSHHISAGSSGGSIVYDLITQKVKDYPFTFQNIKNGIAEISLDGYDEMGHFWQTGKLNMVTGKITWGTKEY